MLRALRLNPRSLTIRWSDYEHGQMLSGGTLPGGDQFGDNRVRAKLDFGRRRKAFEGRVSLEIENGRLPQYVTSPLDQVTPLIRVFTPDGRPMSDGYIEALYSAVSSLGDRHVSVHRLSEDSAEIWNHFEGEDRLDQAKRWSQDFVNRYVRTS